MQNKGKLLVFCALLLTSCNASSVSFKNNLKFDELLGNVERDEVYDAMEMQAEYIKAIEINATSEGQTAFNETKQELTTKYEFFTNGASMTTNVTSNNKQYGVSYKAKRTTTADSWLMRFGGATKLVSYYTDTDADEPTYSVSSVDNYNTNKFGLLLGQLIGNQGIQTNINPSLYKDGKGYALVYSKQNKIVDDVAVGSSTKEYVVSSNAQLVCRINSTYRITSITYYEDYSSNRDPETQEWYKSEKVLSTTKVYASVDYGSPSTRDEESFFEKLNNQKIIWGVKPTIYTTYYQTSMGQVSSSIFTPSVNLTNSSFTYSGSDVDIAEYRTTLVLSNSGDGAANAFLSKANVTIGYLHSDGYSEKMCEISLVPSGGYYGYNSATTTDAEIFYYPSYSGYPYMLEITLHINAVSNVKITEVSVN